MKYLKVFETQSTYDTAYPTLDLPNVSLIDATNEVKYKSKINLTFSYQYNGSTLITETFTHYPNEEYNHTHSSYYIVDGRFQSTPPSGGYYYTYNESSLIGTAPSHDTTIIVQCSRNGGSVTPYPGGGGGAA